MIEITSAQFLLSHNYHIYIACDSRKLKKETALYPFLSLIFFQNYSALILIGGLSKEELSKRGKKLFLFLVEFNNIDGFLHAIAMLQPLQTALLKALVCFIFFHININSPLIINHRQ